MVNILNQQHNNLSFWIIGSLHKSQKKYYSTLSKQIDMLNIKNIRFYGFSLTRMIVGGGIAFVLALIGADLGERIAAKLGNRESKYYASK